MATRAPISIRIRNVKAKLLAVLGSNLVFFEKREMYLVTTRSTDIAINAMNRISKKSARGNPNKFVGKGVDNRGSDVGVDI